MGSQLTQHSQQSNSLPTLRQVTTEETQYIRTVDNLIASRLSLRLQLQAAHFVAAASANRNGNGKAHDRASNAHVTNALGPGLLGIGGLMLRCTAQIGDLYQEYKEIELGTPQKDPVPARGKPQPQQTQTEMKTKT